MGISAIHDGYYREAVTSFAASLERFYEFCIKVLVKSKNIPDDNFNKAWKPLNKLSERQVGAFIMLYLYDFEETPLIFSDKLTEIRNDVIHKGKFISIDECLKYAAGVFNFIKATLLIFKEKHNYIIHDISETKMLNYAMSNCPEESVLGWNLDTVFKSNRPDEEIEELNFNKEFETRKTHKIFTG